MKGYNRPKSALRTQRSAKLSYIPTSITIVLLPRFRQFAKGRFRAIKDSAGKLNPAAFPPL